MAIPPQVLAAMIDAAGKVATKILDNKKGSQRKLTVKERITGKTKK